MLVCELTIYAIGFRYIAFPYGQGCLIGFPDELKAMVKHCFVFELMKPFYISHSRASCPAGNLN